MIINIGKASGDKLEETWTFIIHSYGGGAGSVIKDTTVNQWLKEYYLIHISKGPDARGLIHRFGWWKLEVPD